MATRTESGKLKGLVDREKLRPIHKKVRERHANDSKTAVFGMRAQIRQIDGFLLQSETSDDHFVQQQDLPASMGGQGRAPSALAYMLMGVGF